MKKIKKIIVTGILITILSSSIFTIATGTNVIKTNQNSSPYNGHLRVYIVEPTSRWENYNNQPYHYGFLDFAIDESLSINYQDTYTTTVTWDAGDAGYNNVKENNVMVIAAVFNPESKKAYANPPVQNPFDAHYVDVAAGAKPGETGENEVTEDFTHTVFVEEGTAGWCPYCPAMANALNSVYESGDYPFYFVALITEDRQGNVVNQVAKNRLRNDYNLYAYPSAFFDGGYKVMVGGYEDEGPYRSRIESCGNRDVHEMDLSLTVEWKGDGVIDISVTITNNEEMPNAPPNIPDINGDATIRFKTEYEYKISTTDPDGDTVSYYIDWGDNTATDWTDFVPSGTEITEKHTWDEQGTYNVKVKAKDINGAESEWGTLDLTVQKNTNTDTILVQIITKLLEIFPVLEPILGAILNNLLN